MEILLGTDVPDYTQANLTDIPQLQVLYDAFRATYAGKSAADNAKRIKYSKALAFALLTRYYPASQGYIIEPSSLGPIAKNGMSFILRTGRRDLNHTINPKPSPTRPGPSNEEMIYIMNTQWRWVRPEDITGFVVLAKFAVTDDKTGQIAYNYYPHTYFAIMVDADGPPMLSKAKFTHPSDVLSDALCRSARIQGGYGMLLYGPRLEFYSYHAGKKWEFFQDEVREEEEQDDQEDLKDQEDDSAEEYQDIEPILKPIMEPEWRGPAINTRVTDLSVVEDAFKNKIVPRNITYMDGVVGTRVIEPAIDMPNTPK